MKKISLTCLTAVVLFLTAGFAQAQQFGGSAVVVGGDILVGQTLQNSTNSAIRVYRKSGGEWAEAASLVRSDNDGNDDRFGRAMAADGNTLIVGATLVNNSTGMVYVFERSSDGTWTEVGKLDPGSLVEGQSYGRSVAISDDFVVVGSAGFDDGRGKAYVFNRNDWSLDTSFQADSLSENDVFGMNVAIDGNTVLVSAPLQGEDDRPDGNVYVYTHDADSGEWNAAGMLQKIPGVFDAAQFGFSLMAADGLVGVGVPQLGGGIGGAVLYRGGGGAYNFAGVLLPYFVTQGGNGMALAQVGDDFWMGGGSTIEYTGNDRGGFSAAGSLAGGEIQGGASAFAVGDGFAVVGVGTADGGLGRAYILERSGDDWAVVQTLETEYKDMFPSVTGGQVQCGDGTAGSFTCQDVDMLSFMALGDIGGGRGVHMNDVWGWTDPETDREYALAGRTDGTSFVDITDPMNPEYLGDLPLTEGANPAAWRDIKVYKNHAYIVSDGAGQHGMQIFDLTQLRSVTNAPVTFEEIVHYGQFGSAHNIVINEDTGYAYAVGVNSGGETCGGGLHMINIQDPENPTFAGCFGHEGTGRSGTGYSHDAQCLVYHGPDSEHDGQEICFGLNETAMSIADVTDKDNPVALAVAEYPNAGYTHQGWITEDQRYFYVDDELDEMQGLTDHTRTMIFDITDLDDPVLVKEHMGTQSSIDHNLYIQGNFMYQSNYTSGLRVLDISDPENPVEVGYFDVSPGDDNPATFNGSWSNYPYFESGTIIVTGIESGLFMLKKRQVDI